MQESEWLVPQVALLHTWVVRDKTSQLLQIYYSHTPWALIIIIIIIIIIIAYITPFELCLLTLSLLTS
jgi:hypothetical protein